MDIQAFSVVMDYQARRLDVAALKAGSLVELLHLIPWGGVQLDLPRVKATGLHGWHALGNAVGNAYLQDIASSQVWAQTSCRVPSAVNMLLLATPTCKTLHTFRYGLPPAAVHHSLLTCCLWFNPAGAQPLLAT